MSAFELLYSSLGSFGGWLARLIFKLVLQMPIAPRFPPTPILRRGLVPLKFPRKTWQRETEREETPSETHTVGAQREGQRLREWDSQLAVGLTECTLWGINHLPLP